MHTFTYTYIDFTYIHTCHSSYDYYLILIIYYFLQARRSPIQLRFDEQHQACLTQNQRKDSASSEVAALLCISGRSSRISSVGSQGSAISRGNVSNVSRSPSPSQRPGGSENAPMDVLDQAILARKQELQQDFREFTRNGQRKDGRTVTNGADVAAIKRSIGGSIGMALAKKNPAALGKGPQKQIVGVTPEGTQYYRIKLKPDHLYEDNGLAPNERIVENSSDASKKPPASLSLGHQETPKKAAPHFMQLVQDENRLSPKPTRGAQRAGGSRSPSPATVTVSRKSSFCSLFKSKETIVSPESPTTAGQRKKSAISVLLDSPRDRSRSKSRESEKSAPSQNGTPSKTKSVLAIFKPRSKSKSSSSPIDHEVMAAMDAPRQAPTVDIRFVQEAVLNDPSRPKSAQRLRYYDEPTDGYSIHIPLHTPPEERAMKENMASTSAVVRPSSAPRAGQIRAPPHPPPQPPAVYKPKVVGATAKETPSFHPKNIKPMMTNTTTTTTTTQPVSRSQTPKVYRIEMPDGSIRIPLRTPSDERVNVIGVEINSSDAGSNDANADGDESNWSTIVQRNSSQESQETVVSSQAPSLTSADNNNSGGSGQAKANDNLAKATESTAVTECINAPVSSTAASKPTPDLPPATSQVQSMIASPLTKEKKRILFSTRIGSGSDEQIFATQLSLSKTESLSSQLSEQATLDSPPHDATAPAPAPANGNKTRSEAIVHEPPQVVKLRHKDENGAKRTDSSSSSLTKDELINSNRHSMYIENIDEILEREKQNDLARKELKRQKVSTEPKLESNSSNESANKLHLHLSTDDRAPSSEKESDSEADHSISKLHMPGSVGGVEEDCTGLVAQESYDDELPYVPTTLPEERSCAIPIIPVKERALMEVKTYPVDRPRSTTPLNPAYLEDYCGSQPEESEFLSGRGEKLRISLPRKESRDRGQKNKSPRRVSNSSGKSWFEFAEQGIGGAPTVGSPSSVSSITAISGSAMVSSTGSGRRSSNSNTTDDEPPPVPPRKTQTTTEWINFENIPEKRKAPKRITTLPQKDSQEICSAGPSHPVQYNYVNPDECQCECHVDGATATSAAATNTTPGAGRY